jgi:23S rRNA (uracil1939-C5)-methyltransferase
VTIVRLRATSVAAGGDAVARDDDGRVVFVTGALPGELVSVALDDERARFARGHVVEVEEPSAARVAPPCEYVAQGCGGCTWQHIDPAVQRSLKVDIVRDALTRLGHIDEPRVDPGPDLPATNHRTTVRMAVVDGRVAFRRHHSHDPLAVEHCLVAHPMLNEIIAGGRFPGAEEVTMRCGVATGDRLVVAAPSAADSSVPDGVVLVGLDELRAGHRAWIHEEVSGIRFRISARSFFQARPDGAAALVDAVQAAVAGAPDGLLVDAYGGVGLFSATVGEGRPITLVEWSASAVADAKVNVPGAKYLRLDVARWRPSPAAVVVADPARTGLGRKAAAALAGTGATHLALVSCDPASLGRDAALLAGHGFRHDGSTLVDLFPHTPHAEVVTRFIRNAPQHRRGGQ